MPTPEGIEMDFVKIKREFQLDYEKLRGYKAGADLHETNGNNVLFNFHPALYEFASRGFDKKRVASNLCFLTPEYFGHVINVLENHLSLKPPDVVGTYRLIFNTIQPISARTCPCDEETCDGHGMLVDTFCKKFKNHGRF